MRISRQLTVAGAIALALLGAPRSGLAAGADCNGNGVPDDVDTRVRFSGQIVHGAWAARSTTADLDGDGDRDLLTNTAGGISWFENVDGVGSFGPEQAIDNTGGSVFPVDLDGDGDLDVLSASGSLVRWYENEDGAAGFGTAIPIDSFAENATSAVGGDIDGDGDADVVTIHFVAGRIVWYRNLGGGVFGIPNVATSSLPNPVPPVLEDLDADGDLDIVSGARTGSTLVWLENFGGPIPFAPPTEIPSSLALPNQVATADLDGDGDPDVLAGASGGKVTWYPNDGAGNFGVQHLIFQFQFPTNSADSVVPADLDGDGDIDVLVQAYSSGTVRWFRNAGDGSFQAEDVLFSNLAEIGTSLHSADLDGDGDREVVVATTDRLAWYDNLSDDCNGNQVPDSCDVGFGQEPDCNGNQVPDSCDLSAGNSPDCNLDAVADECTIASGATPDCNVNGRPDECDLESRYASDCNGNAVPDECDTGCTDRCDTDGDGCVDSLDAAPDDPNVCADVDGDECQDCSSGSFDPSSDGGDWDQDGHCDLTDCDPLDPEIWSGATAAQDLRLTSESGTTSLTWAPPESPGSVSVRFDLLRSEAASEFFESTICVESDEVDTVAFDADSPPTGAPRFYLIRAENTCPGMPGEMGADSSGTPREGRACP